MGRAGTSRRRFGDGLRAGPCSDDTRGPRDGPRLRPEWDDSMTTIYVGNLPFSATEDEIRGLFEKHGAVESVKLINDRETGRPRGFGFVEMSGSDAQAAIAQMNGFDMGGRQLRVNEAQERPARGPRPGGGGGGYGRGGGGGGGGYGGGGGGYGNR
jgi:hypothetical protein